MKQIQKKLNLSSIGRNWKINKKFFYTIGLTSILLVSPTLVLSTNLNSKFIESNKVKNNNALNDNLSIKIENQDASEFQNQVKPLVPSYVNYVNRLVSTSMGPIVHYNNELVSLDWFGAQRWKLNTIDYAPNKGQGLDKTWDRAWLNIVLDRQKNQIWMLTNGSTNGTTYRQKLIQIDVISGKVLSENQIPNATKLFFNITFLESGKVMVFDDREKNFTPRYVLFDPSSKSFIIKEGDIGNNSMVSQPEKHKSSFMFFANVIPISNNRNIVMVINFPNMSTSGDQGSAYATSDIYFILADDNLNKVSNSGYWSTGHVAVKGLQGYRNSKIWPQMDYYKLLDGRTVAMIYNSLVVINPTDSLAPDKDNISFKVYSVGEKWIMSWSFDTRERLYFKFKDDSKIYQIPIIPSSNENNITVTDYYDLSSSPIDSVRNNANTFVIYAVHGYSGSLMLINSYFNELINPSVWPTNEQIKSKLYGLALGIVPNQTNSDVGDTKGLLNTENAFQFSADFTIEKNVLDKKIPSEITSDDLTFLNKGFLTKNTQKNNDGSLKYPPFIKSNINDESKQFTIQVNLDQIPWFTDKLPENSIPLTITRLFSTTDGINSRIKWKDANQDYDFINTLPNKVDMTDLKRFNPFLIDLNSQKVTNNNGQQIYPKKEYQVIQSDNSTGKIEIKVKYTYMPLGVKISEKNELSYEFKKEYQIFKISDNKTFLWNTNNLNVDSPTSNISLIPSLKKFVEANVLPSSINAKETNGLLDFINLNSSKGYPISKMKSTILANDNQGTLSLSLALPNDYYGEEKSFTHTYTNLNKVGNYTFNYKTPSSLIKLEKNIKNNYATLLPSQVNEEQIFADFITYSGYDGLDLITRLLPDDEKGSLTVQVELTNNYPPSVATINTFKLINGKYISQYTFNNFLTKNEYQQQYVVNFKNNNDKSLIDIKNMEVNVILEAIKPGGKGLIIGDKKYNSETDLIELFIKSKGVSIPKINDTNIKIYGDNQSGILTFELLFNENETSLSYPLSFTQTFTGFLQGVSVPTDDIFIFKNQETLANDLIKKLPSQIAEEIFKNPTLVNNYFIQNLSGEFIELIKDSNNYEINTYPNDLTGTLGIIIKFKKIKNPNTLKLYSKSYVGFNTIQ